MQDQKPILGNGFAHYGKIQIPFHKDRAGDIFQFWLQNHQHPLLAFGQHHLVSGHMRFALRHRIQLQLDAKPALIAHLYRRAGQASGPHVLDRDHSTRGHKFQTRFQQTLFGEGVANLHCRALFLDRGVKFGRSHRGPTNPVTARLSA